MGCRVVVVRWSTAPDWNVPVTVMVLRFIAREIVTALVRETDPRADNWPRAGFAYQTTSGQSLWKPLDEPQVGHVSEITR